MIMYSFAYMHTANIILSLVDQKYLDSVMYLGQEVYKSPMH